MENRDRELEKDLGNRIIGYIVLGFSILCMLLLMGLGVASGNDGYKPNSTRDLDLNDFTLESPNGSITEFVDIKNKSFDELIEYFEGQGYKDVITHERDTLSNDKVNAFNEVWLEDKEDYSNDYSRIRSVLNSIEMNKHTDYEFYIDEEGVYTENNKEIEVSVLRNDAMDTYLIIAYSELNNMIGIKPVVGIGYEDKSLYGLFDKWKPQKKYKIKNYSYIESWDSDFGILSINSESDSINDYECDYDGLVDLELYDKNRQNTNILYYVNDRKVSYE